MQVSPNLPPQRPWTVVGFLDGTDRKLEPSTTREVVDLSHTPKDSAMILNLRRSAPSAGMEKVRGNLEKLLLPAAIVAAGGAILGLGLPIGIAAYLMTNAVGTGVCTWIAGDQRLKALNKRELFHQEADWKGSRTYDLTVKSPGDALSLPSAVSLTGSAKAPKAQSLSQQMVGGLGKYPSAYTAVLFSGHGDAYRKVAGIKLEEAAQSLKATAEKTGHKVDLVIFEACKMGSLEGLSKCAEGAKFAVVAEDVIWDAGVPWQTIIPAMDRGASPQEVGKTIVANTGGLQHEGDVKIPQMALIDLEKLAAVKVQVEHLSAQINERMSPAMKKSLLQSFAETQHFPRPEKNHYSGLAGAAEGMLRRVKREIVYPDIGDLGGFLKALDSHVTDPQLKQSIQQAQQTLKEAVVSNQVHPTMAGKATGLSIRMTSPIHFKQHYGDRTGLHEWGKVIDSLRPWRARVGSALLENTWQWVTNMLPGRKSD